MAKKATDTNSSSNHFSNNVSGFMTFLREQGIVGIAIGFIMGVQSKALVDQFARSFIDPLLGLLLGESRSLSSATFTLSVGGRSADFGWGAFIYAIINFVFIAATVYFVFRWLNLAKLDKKKD